MSSSSRSPRAIRGASATSILFLVLLTGCGGNKTTAPTPTTPTPDPPTIACPAAAAVTSSTSTPVTFADPVVSNGKTPLTTSCTPPSGSSFPVGTTIVSCKTTDALQRLASCTFNVTVTPPPIISLTRFVAFGDSITWGQDGQDDPNATPLRVKPLVQVLFPYPIRLLQYLDARYTTQAAQLSMLNAGNPGEIAGSDTTITRFGDVVVRGGTYDAVLLMEGSNDVNLIPGDAGAQNRALSALQSMIDFAKQHGVQPYLATLPPMNPAGMPSRVAGASFVSQFNVAVAGLASTEGIPLVDVNANISLSLLAPDGLHLRQAGYDKIAQVFLDKLETTAEAPVKTTSLARPAR
ncbi:MAG TPA: GDSL-type esterase/lipase family protein [Vicinamibacterales bacterium]|nr:GDSL-type esterase/lipase family protein [Vicinamibacterales bacterium]